MSGAGSDLDLLFYYFDQSVPLSFRLSIEADSDYASPQIGFYYTVLIVGRSWSAFILVLIESMRMSFSTIWMKGHSSTHFPVSISQTFLTRGEAGLMQIYVLIIVLTCAGD